MGRVHAGFDADNSFQFTSLTCLLIDLRDDEIMTRLRSKDEFSDWHTMIRHILVPDWPAIYGGQTLCISPAAAQWDNL